MKVELLTLEDMEKMQAVDIQTVDSNTLADLTKMTIDTSKPVKERIREFVSQTPNIYMHRIGDYVVKTSYTDTEETISDRMKYYIQKLAEITY